MKKTILALLSALCFAGAAHASSEGPSWDTFPKDRLTDMAALQRGAKLFVNYCFNCHAASYLRYNRLHDIGLTDQQIKDNLIFNGGKVGDLMTLAMDPKDAKEWFGATPPDLTLVARSRADPGKGSGSDYLYTYLRTYYRDPSRPTGWNNLAFPGVGMPNPLWELQGQQRAVFEEEKDPHDPSKTTHVFKKFEPITAGTMSTEQFNASVADLVAFLTWASEPVANQRVRLGVWVLMFIAVFGVVAWRMNAAFWKDVK